MKRVNQPVITSSDLATILKDMLVDPDNDDFRPKWGSHLHRLDAGAYDADDSNPWTAGIGWTYTRSSNYTTGCMDSIALNYDQNAGFDDGSCRYLEADIGERVAILNKAIEPITFTESLSNFDFGTWSTGVSNGRPHFLKAGVSQRELVLMQIMISKILQLLRMEIKQLYSPES